MEPKALKKSSAKRSLSKYGARRKEASDMAARRSGERYSERMASANPLTYCSPVGTMMALSVPTSHSMSTTTTLTVVAGALIRHRP